MSHVLLLILENYKVDILKKAVTKMGLVLEEGNFEIAGSSKRVSVNYKIQGKNIGFSIVGDRVSLVADWWKQGYGNGKEFTDRLDFEYNTVFVMNKCRERGLSLSKVTVLPSGDRQLIATMVTI